jgi:uncharacterized membrane protein
MPWNNQRTPDVVEKIISGLCYLSFGLIGLLYIILNGKSSNSGFFRFHFLQAILLGILGVLLNWTSSAIVGVVAGILGLFGSSVATVDHTVMMVIGTGIDMIAKAGILLNLYGAVWAFLGKYAEIPFLSDLVRQQSR